ncbi:MAG TPA: hypothetical protein VFO70_12025 [Chitinophagaceae bacterium]|nr:hypothetical protein [Chitinophagaceae bacterium]
MSETEIKLRGIQEKLQQLLRQFASVQKENARLRDELIQLKDQASVQQKNVESLKQQLDIMKMNAGTMNEEDKKEFEKKINNYLKEIDRCITLLSE